MAAYRPADEDVLKAEAERAMHPFTQKPGDVNRLRDNLLDLMWDDVGVIRDEAGLDRGIAKIDEIESELLRTGIADSGGAFNVSWHDWLNLRSLCEMSRVIALAAKHRQNSRGAHYRSDFPDPGELETSRFTVARQIGRQDRAHRRAGAVHPRQARRVADPRQDRRGMTGG